MKTISASFQTLFVKRVLPVVWLGAVGMMVAVSLGIVGKAPPLQRGDALLATLPPLAFAVVGFFLFRKLYAPLADEVRDAGDALLVRRGAQTRRVPIGQIINVNYGTASGEARIVLRLAVADADGDEIAFISSGRRTFSITKPTRDPVAEDLIARVDAARRRG